MDGSDIYKLCLYSKCSLVANVLCVQRVRLELLAPREKWNFIPVLKHLDRIGILITTFLEQVVCARHSIY